MGYHKNSNRQVEVRKETKIDVKINSLTDKIDSNKKWFTEIEVYYSDRKPNVHKGIIDHYSVMELCDRINTIPATSEKSDSPAILKGIYNDGTKGEYCTIASPFLFFDIDVKKGENEQLLDPFTNSNVFDYLKQISVITFKSYSGNGMAGLLFVPQLEHYLNDERKIHNEIGGKIVTELSALLKTESGTTVKFDVAQNKFRQVRYLAKQSSAINVNETPKQFDITVAQEEIKPINNVVQYTYSYHTPSTGSIEEQYNDNNSIEEEMIRSGFENTTAHRYKHPSTTSNSSGAVDINLNVFFNHSTSYSSKTCFTPFQLRQKSQNKTKAKLLSDLRKEGYTDKIITKEEVSVALTKFNQTSTSNEDLFKISTDLKSLSIEAKHEFVENVTIPDHKNYFHTYANFIDLKITYDKVFSFDNHVSECLEDILSYADSNENICLTSETGTGKTTAIMKDFSKHRAGSRCLLIVPLISITDQLKAEYPDIICLDGRSTSEEHSESRKRNFVVATYEQGTKHITDRFDYVFIDEFHNMITAYSYKKQSLILLSEQLKLTSAKIIGLTGTPIALLKNIGYNLVNTVKRTQKPVEVILRIENRSGYKAMLQHQKSVSGKVMYRLNNVDRLKTFRKYLISKLGFKRDEIFLLYSDQVIKASKEYRHLIKYGKFKDEIKVVLTTSFIDEGISIYQDEFTDIVYIEDHNFSPRPEQTKQFFARFRNEDPNRANYFYRKSKKNNSHFFIDEKEKYLEIKNHLIDNKNDVIDYQTYLSISNNEKFYFSDKSINDFMIVYFVTNKTFNCLNNYEYETYLKLNYNLILNPDTSYKSQEVDNSLERLCKAEKETKLAFLWVHKFEEILNVISEITQDSLLKRHIGTVGSCFNHNDADFIEEHQKSIEKLLKYFFRLKELGEEPINHIINGSKIRGAQWLDNRLIKLETLKLIKDPITKSDNIERSKLVVSINSIITKKSFNMRDVKKEFLKVLKTSSVSNTVIIEIIKEFAVITYNKRSKIYNVVSHTNLE